MRCLVVIGASGGGLAALQQLLRGLTTQPDAALLFVQHRSKDSHPTALGQLLAAAATFEVCDVNDKIELKPGRLYVAPPDYHVLVEGEHLALSTEGAVAYSGPSIDAAFESAAEAYGEGCVGVVLTGANADGAAGLARIVELGGEAVVQDPSSAERAEMPRAALAAVPDARVCTLEEMPGVLVELCAGMVRSQVV